MKVRIQDFLHSIRLRLVLSYLFVALLAVALIGLLGITLIRTYAVQREQENLALYAELTRAHVQPLLNAAELPSADIQAEVERISRLGDVRVKVVSPSGEVIADSGHPASLQELQRLADEMAKQGNVQVIVRDDQGNLLVESDMVGNATVFALNEGSVIDQDNSSYRPSTGGVPIVVQLLPARSGEIKTLPVISNSNLIAQIEVSEGPTLVGEAVNSATKAFQTAGWVAILVSLLVGLVVSIRLSAPLVQLTGAVEQMQTGDLSARAAVNGKDEVSRLASQFNAMAQQLEKSFGELQSERDTLRRFVADASHELRTPLTALKMSSELLEIPGNDPEEQAEILANIQVEIDRVTWITTNLLDLSRMDAGINQPAFETCRAVDLLQSAVSAFETRAAEQGVKLEITLGDADIILPCDRPRIEMALTNLLDNAIKFSSNGGTVCAGVKANQKEISFWVRDCGPGIDAEDLPNVFDRFYRGKNRNIPGSGLGLAIVKSVAEVHHGRAEVISKPGEGVYAVIHLPLNRETP